MEQRNDISIDIVNNIPMSEYGINKRYQTPKYTILKNGAYYVHHGWYKNQKVREKVALPWPPYGHKECSFKLFTQTFIYKILPKK